MPDISQPNDAPDRLADMLGDNTAQAMIKAAGKVRQHPLAEPRDMIAAILVAALDGLDGTELAPDMTSEDLDIITDRVAVHIGADLGRRLNHAYAGGYRDGLAAVAFPTDRWLIWSVKHSNWWRRGGHGYTAHLDQAGRFTHDAARHETSTSWNYETDTPSSVMVPAPSLQLLACPEVAELMTLRTIIAIDTAAQHHDGEEEGHTDAGQ